MVMYIWEDVSTSSLNKERGKGKGEFNYFLIMQIVTNIMKANKAYTLNNKAICYRVI